MGKIRILCISIWLLMIRSTSSDRIAAGQPVNIIDVNNSTQAPIPEPSTTTKSSRERIVVETVQILNVSANVRKTISCQFECGIYFTNFNCNCRLKNRADEEPVCIPQRWVCDGWADCKDGSDEMDCICQEDEFQCSACKRGGWCITNHVYASSYQCIPKTYFEDEVFDCTTGTDEPYLRSAFSLRCDSDPDIICDGFLHCARHAPNDEDNCSSCPENLPYRCRCNQRGNLSCTGERYVCYSEALKCNKMIDCTDATDEIGCPCDANEFLCDCYSASPPTCFFSRGCIPLEKYGDGIKDCPDGSDETILFNVVKCGDCNVALRRLNNVSQCNDIGYPSCDNATCYETPSLNCSSNQCDQNDIICTSHCNDNITEIPVCNSTFQCSDGSLILAYQFCDGAIHCLDRSDEISNQPGFKCKQSDVSCVLPQSNLYDNVAHCENQYDLCNDNYSCFECLDKRLLISSKQLCDGVINCYDFSDECLCEININKPNCDAIFSSNQESPSPICTDNTLTRKVNQKLLDNNPTLLYSLAPGRDRININDFLSDVKPYGTRSYCQTKYDNSTLPTLCDGRPDCRDFSDECNCENPPSYCNDTCYSFYHLGDRYCDGIEDPAWKFINQLACPQGFDEKFCPSRYYCKSGDKVSIDSSQVCDGVVNCDDGSDEGASRCSGGSLFSSETEMIANPVLRAAFWIMSFVVICGNLFVMVTTSRFLKTTKLTSLLRSQHIILLNISFADFIMGIYLLTTSIFSVIFSGFYGSVDVEWRTSFRCSIIGSLAVISSEASCFLMVVLTAQRLYSICKPFAARTASALPWRISIGAAWLLALTLGILPIPYKSSDYFVHTVSFKSKFANDDIWETAGLTKFACRFAALTNQSIINVGSKWKSTRNFLESSFPRNFLPKEFGYYGETSVCMPRFYVARGDNAWEYSLAIITVNFLVFAFIVASYVSIFYQTNKQAMRIQQINQSNTSNQENKMQKRIARIIATDFFCWIPICIMAYVRISGVQFSNLVYQITAVFLLPINSALNPFLYSDLPDKLMEKLACRQNRQGLPNGV